jgi:hypothetical protein
VNTDASLVTSRKSAEMSRTCCSMIKSLPEDHPKRREMISLISDITVCIRMEILRTRSTVCERASRSLLQTTAAIANEERASSSFNGC